MEEKKLITDRDRIKNIFMIVIPSLVTMAAMLQSMSLVLFAG